MVERFKGTVGSPEVPVRDAVPSIALQNDAGRSFVIRQKRDCRLRWGLRTIETARFAVDCPLFHATHIVREGNGEEVRRRLDYDFHPVRLPEHPDNPLRLVVVRRALADGNKEVCARLPRPRSASLDDLSQLTQGLC